MYHLRGARDTTSIIKRNITIKQWLPTPEAREAKIAALDALKQKVAGGGSTRKTVDYILEHLLPPAEAIPTRRAA